MMPQGNFIKIDTKRMQMVYEETAAGSEPALRSCILVVEIF
jgi:hypothetical protein